MRGREWRNESKKEEIMRARGNKLGEKEKKREKERINGNKWKSSEIVSGKDWIPWWHLGRKKGK